MTFQKNDLVIIRATGEAGIVLTDCDFPPKDKYSVYPGKYRKKRNEPTKMHYFVELEDGSKEWFSKWELAKV